MIGGWGEPSLAKALYNGSVLPVYFLRIMTARYLQKMQLFQLFCFSYVSG